MTSPQYRRAFTVLELLTAIAVISILMALMLPAVQQSRESARRTQCAANVRQLAIGLHNYHDVHQILPAGAYVSGPTFPVQTGWGWGAMILPYLDQAPLYDRIDFNVGTSTGSNINGVIETPIPLWACPSDIAPGQIDVDLPGGATIRIATGNYCGAADALKAMSDVRFRDMTDGLSQCLLVGERVYQEGDATGAGQSTSGWYGHLSYGLDYLPQSTSYLSATAFYGINYHGGSAVAFGSRHSGGAQFAFADGSLRFLSENMNGHVFASLGTIAGGEAVEF